MFKESCTWTGKQNSGEGALTFNTFLLQSDKIRQVGKLYYISLKYTATFWWKQFCACIFDLGSKLAPQMNLNQVFRYFKCWMTDQLRIKGQANSLKCSKIRQCWSTFRSSVNSLQACYEFTQSETAWSVPSCAPGWMLQDSVVLMTTISICCMIYSFGFSCISLLTEQIYSAALHYYHRTNSLCPKCFHLLVFQTAGNKLEASSTTVVPQGPYRKLLLLT